MVVGLRFAMKPACQGCAKAALELSAYQLSLRLECIRAIDSVIGAAVEGNWLVWALTRALEDAEAAAAARHEEEQMREKAERARQRAVEKAEKEALKAAELAEKEAARAVAEAAKAMAKAKAKEEARQRQQTAEEEARVAAEAARAAAEAKSAAREEAKQAERQAKAEASAQKQVAREAAAADAAERKAAADRAKAEAEMVKLYSSDIARRDREAREAEARERKAAAEVEKAEKKAAAEADKAERAAERERADAAERAERATERERASKAEASSSPRAEDRSTAGSISQQRLERAHSRLSSFMPQRNSSTAAEDSEEGGGGSGARLRSLSLAGAAPKAESGRAFKISLGMGGRKTAAAAQALANDLKAEEDEEVEAVPAVNFGGGQSGGKGGVRATWSRGGKVAVRVDVATDCIAVRGDEVVCAGADGDKCAVCVYSLAAGGVALSLSGHTDRIISVATLGNVSSSADDSDDGDGGGEYIIASGSRDRTIRLWSRLRGECLRVLEGSGDSVYSLAMHAGLILSGEPSSHQGAIAKARLWSVGYVQFDSGVSVTSASVKSTFAEHGGPVWSVALNAEHALTASDDATARVWPVIGASARSVATLKHPAWVCCVSLAADGTLCATGCGDSKIRLWSLHGGSPTAYTCLVTVDHCSGSSGTYPMRVRWLPGGALVSSGLDDTVRVWALSSTGEATSVAALPHEESVRGLAASASLSFVASSGGSKSKSITVWKPKSWYG